MGELLEDIEGLLAAGLAAPVTAVSSEAIATTLAAVTGVSEAIETTLATAAGLVATGWTCAAVTALVVAVSSGAVATALAAVTGVSSGSVGAALAAPGCGAAVSSSAGASGSSAPWPCGGLFECGIPAVCSGCACRCAGGLARWAEALLGQCSPVTGFPPLVRPGTVA